MPDRRRSTGLAGLVLVALLAGCAAPAAPATLDVRTGDVPNQDAVALPGDLDAQLAHAVDTLPQIAATALERTGVPGMAIAVVHGDEVVFADGFGVREVGTDDAVTPDTVFQIASVSKSLSATAVAAAIDDSDGAIGWDTPIHELLPGFAFSDPTVTELATIADAFSHRTGLATGAGDDLEDLGFDAETILERLRLQPLDAFRSSYHYSNFGLTVGASAVAAFRGESWDALMDELVFEPLGMTASSARHDDFLAHEDRALLHTLEDGAFVAAFDRDPDAEAPAGGVSSTAGDLARWMRMLLAGGTLDGVRIADEDALARAMTAQTVSGAGPDITGRAAHYGFGFNVSSQASGRVSVSHSGAFVLGAATSFQLVPALDLGIVVLTNGAPVGVPEAVAAQFLDEVQYGHVTRDWIADAGRLFAGYTTPVGDLAGRTPPADAEPSSPLDALVGAYDNPYFGPLRVVRRGDGLELRFGAGEGVVLPLTAWDGDVFSYAPRTENAPYGSLASATFSAGTLRLDTFDEQGLGTWRRRD